MPSQPRRRNKLPYPSTPLLLLFHIKRFAQQNLAAGGIHFRRGYSFPVRGPRKMPRHFVGTDKSSWTSCILPSQPRRRNKLPITSKRSGRCPLLFRLSKKPRRVRGPQAANRVPSIFRGGAPQGDFRWACTSRKILCAGLGPAELASADPTADVGPECVRGRLRTRTRGSERNPFCQKRAAPFFDKLKRSGRCPLLLLQ